MISQIIEANPRELKRFLNNLILSFALVTQEDGMDEENLLIIEAFKSRWEEHFLKFTNESLSFKKSIEEHIGKNYDEIREMVSAKRKDQGEGGAIPQDYETMYKMSAELWDFLKDVGEKLFAITPKQWPLYILAARTIDVMDKIPSNENVINFEMLELLQQGKIKDFNKTTPKILNLSDANFYHTNFKDAEFDEKHPPKFGNNKFKDLFEDEDKDVLQVLKTMYPKILVHFLKSNDPKYQKIWDEQKK